MVSFQGKLLIGLMCLLVSLGVGFYFGHKNSTSAEPIIEVVEKEKIVEIKGEERVIFKDRVITVTKEIVRTPDGTVTERETSNTSESEKETETTSSSISSEKDKEVVVTHPRLPEYSLGLNLEIPFDEVGRKYRPDARDLEITAGYRVFSSLWTVVEFKPSNRVLALGISWQW